MVEKLTEAQLKALVFEFALEGDLYKSWGGAYSDGMREVCALMKVDLRQAERLARRQRTQESQQDQSPAVEPSAEVA